MALAVGVPYFLWDRAGTVGSRWYCQFGQYDQIGRMSEMLMTSIVQSRHLMIA